MSDIVTESHNKYKLEMAIAEVLAAARTWAAARVEGKGAWETSPEEYFDAWRATDVASAELERVVSSYAALADTLDDADYPDGPDPGGQFLDPLAGKPPSVPVPLAWLPGWKRFLLGDDEKADGDG